MKELKPSTKLDGTPEENERAIQRLIDSLSEEEKAESMSDKSILQVLCKYKIVQKNLFKWTELNSVRFYVIRKISTCQ